MPKLTTTSVTIFIHKNDDYLFLKRDVNLKINPGQLNGVGGKLESGEDYLTAAIRETEEETGYKIAAEEFKLCGIIKFESKDREDWVTCFYKAEVKDKNIPIGNMTKDGELIWLNKSNVLSSSYELVEDLYYIFKDIVSAKEIFFLNAKTEGNEYRIIKVSGKKVNNYRYGK